MKAAVFYEKNNIEIAEKKIPSPAQGEVLVKVRACGVCGTDVHIYSGDEGAAKTPSGTVLGHEFSGEIVALGEGVSGFRLGQRVAVDPNKLCCSCPACLGGMGHFCNNMTGIGTTVDGGFEEYVSVSATQLAVFPESVPFEKACMTEPVSCCLHGIDMCDIVPGDTVAVIGCGMIGLLMLQLAKLKGAARIIAIEPVEEKRNAALRLGADYVIDPALSSAEEIASRFGRIACVIECVGKVSTMELAVALAGYKSTVMLFGLTAPSDEMKIRPFEIFKKEITLKASFINPYTFGRALELICSGRIDVSETVMLRPLEELPLVLSSSEERKKGKTVITFPY